MLREKYADNSDAQAELDAVENEIELFRKYSDYYGYMFYVMKKK